MSDFEWPGLIVFQEGRNPLGEMGWWCRSPDEKYEEWGRTKREAEENLKRLLTAVEAGEKA